MVLNRVKGLLITRHEHISALFSAFDPQATIIFYPRYQNPIAKLLINDCFWGSPRIFFGFFNKTRSLSNKNIPYRTFESLANKQPLRAQPNKAQAAPVSQGRDILPSQLPPIDSKKKRKQIEIILQYRYPTIYFQRIEGLNDHFHVFCIFDTRWYTVFPFSY